MAVYKTQGIIIKRRNYGEADRIITIFTYKHGKVVSIAKSVRKILSRLGGHLELFNITDFVLAEGRNFDIITAAQEVETFWSIRQFIQLTSASYLVAEVVDRLTQEKQAQHEIYELLATTLRAIDSKEFDYQKLKLLATFFIVNFLSLSGYRPQLQRCVNCSQNLSINGNQFDFGAGGIRCQRCAKDNLPISVGAIKLLRLFLGGSPTLVKKLKLSDNTYEEVEKILRYYLRYLFDINLKSWQFLKETKNFNEQSRPTRGKS